MPKKNDSNGINIISKNRRAFFDYEVLDTFEAGISLQGSEVKSLRLGRCSIGESYIDRIGSSLELELVNSSIVEYIYANNFGHEERRKRKLLLHKKEILQIIQGISRKGYTCIPLKMYFKGGRAKIEIALARGKNDADKRQDIKERDWRREQAKVIKDYNIKT